LVSKKTSFPVFPESGYMVALPDDPNDRSR